MMYSGLDHFKESRTIYIFIIIIIIIIIIISSSSSNGNRTEWSTIQGVIRAPILNYEPDNP